MSKSHSTIDAKGKSCFSFLLQWDSTFLPPACTLFTDRHKCYGSQGNTTRMGCGGVGKKERKKRHKLQWQSEGRQPGLPAGQGLKDLVSAAFRQARFLDGATHAVAQGSKPGGGVNVFPFLHPIPRMLPPLPPPFGMQHGHCYHAMLPPTLPSPSSPLPGCEDLHSVFFTT